MTTTRARVLLRESTVPLDVMHGRDGSALTGGEDFLDIGLGGGIVPAELSLQRTDSGKKCWGESDG